MKILTIGDKIRAERRRAKLTQVQLAERMGVTQSLIGQYERGEINPKLDTLERIADALGVHVSKLLEYADEIELPVKFTLEQEMEWIRNGAPISYGDENSVKAAALVELEKLNQAGQRCGIDLLRLVSKVPEYRKEN